MEFPDLQNLAAYHRKVEIIRETAAQIQKDFALEEEPIHFSGNPETAYVELQSQIEPLIRRYLDLDASYFFRLMYRIDIDEQLVKRILFGRDEVDAPAEITNLILERELKKVIIRWHFRSSENPA